MADTTSFSPAPFAVAKHLPGPSHELSLVDPCLSALIVGAFSSPSHGSRGISEDVCARLVSAGWQMRIVSRRSSRLGRFCEMLWTSWLERHRYSLAAVDLYSGPAFYWAKAVCALFRCAGKPYVLMLHGGDLPKFAARRPKSVQRLLSSAVAVTAPSEYLKDRMQPYWKNIQVLPNAINVAAYPFQVRRRVSRMIWLRAFHEVYNPVMAIRVLALLRPEFPDLHLTMIGPDKGDGSLQRTQEEAERLGVTSCLTLLGSVRKQDVPEHLAAADIFLNTTSVDNTPVSVLEAMATGLCVVSTNVGGIPYLVQSGQDALLTSPDSAVAMAQAIRRIILDPDLARTLSSNARRKAEHLDWSIVLPRWQALFGSVAKAATNSASRQNV